MFKVTMCALLVFLSTPSFAKDDPVDLTCLVYTGEKNCQDFFGDPTGSQYCSGGQECEFMTCPGNATEVRNSSDWYSVKSTSRPAVNGEAGFLAEERLFICTAERACTCHWDWRQWKFFCVLGPASSQINTQTFTYGVTPATGGGPCIGAPAE